MTRAALLLTGVIIMTPIPPDKLPKYQDEAVVWPQEDERQEHMIDRWLTNYCVVLTEPCPLLIPHWAGWGIHRLAPRIGP